LALFCTHRTEKLQLLILSHLSKNNNDPQVVEKMFASNAGNTKVVVASRYAASPVFEITSKHERVYSVNQQLSFF
jgi:hypothetical protein